MWDMNIDIGIECSHFFLFGILICYIAYFISFAIILVTFRYNFAVFLEVLAPNGVDMWECLISFIIVVFGICTLSIATTYTLRHHNWEGGITIILLFACGICNRYETLFVFGCAVTFATTYA